jgi:hypothetical protein
MPDLPQGMSHAERLEAAEQLAHRILEAYGDAVLAVFVTSSTARGLDRWHSDLELTAVVRDGLQIAERSYVHRGILIEIEYIQESAILKHAGEVNRRWPLQADEYRGRIVLFERDGWLRRLDQALEERDAGDLSTGLHLATMVLIECRDKVRNAYRAGDALDLRVCAYWVAENAALLVLFLNRRPLTTSSRMFRQAFECPVGPTDLQRQVEILMGVTPAEPDDLLSAAERLTTDLVEIVRTRGIVVESADLVV